MGSSNTATLGTDGEEPTANHVWASRKLVGTAVKGDSNCAQVRPIVSLPCAGQGKGGARAAES